MYKSSRYVKDDSIPPKLISGFSPIKSDQILLSSETFRII